MRLPSPFHVALKKKLNSATPVFGNTEIKAFPQLELVSLFSQACHTAWHFSLQAIGVEEGRMQAGMESCVWLLLCQTANHRTLHSVTGEAAVAPSLESPPESCIIRQPQGMTSPDSRPL